jgi:phage terminase small subunit
MSRAELTAKQQRFAEEYVKDFNATQAAARAGYSKKSAEWIGPQLLQKPHVAEKVEELRAAQTERAGSDADRIKAALRAIAYSDQRKYQRWGPTGVEILESSGLTDEEAVAVAEVSQTITEAGGSIRMRQHDKLRAIELLAKMEGLLPNKVEVTTTPALEELRKLGKEEILRRIDELRAAREAAGK